MTKRMVRQTEDSFRLVIQNFDSTQLAPTAFDILTAIKKILF